MIHLRIVLWSPVSEVENEFIVEVDYLTGQTWFPVKMGAFQFHRLHQDQIKYHAAGGPDGEATGSYPVVTGFDSQSRNQEAVPG